MPNVRPQDPIEVLRPFRGELDIIDKKLKEI